MFVSGTALASFFLAAPAAQAALSASFSYDPTLENGPQNWGMLPIDGNACDGQKNSPIAVTTSECTKWGSYRFSAGTCATNDLTYTLTTTGVKASFPETDGVCTNPTVKIPGIDGEYKALQFHVHTSSEHTINGNYYGAELHIVHQEIDGDRFAVVGMMIEPDSDVENDIFGQLLDGWDAEMTKANSACALERGGFRKLLGADSEAEKDMERHLRQRRSLGFSPYDLLPANATFYHYDGGLTTPPCSEVVWWNLADKPVVISPSQYRQLVDQVLNFIDPATCEKGTYAGPAGSTSRPVQPLNGRTVDRICPAGFGYGVEDASPKCAEDKPTTSSTTNENSNTQNVEEYSSAFSSVMSSTLVLASAAVAALML